MAVPRRSGGSRSRQEPAARRSSPKLQLNRATARKGVSLLLRFVILLLLVLMLIWERVTVNKLAVEIATLETQRNQLLDQNGKLRIQVEQLAGFGRISHLASQRLGLAVVPQQIIVVEEE